MISKSQYRRQASQREDRYICYECGSEHSTDNVVAYCALCVHAIKAGLNPTWDKVDIMNRYAHELSLLTDVYRKECAAHTKTLQREAEAYGRIRNLEKAMESNHDLTQCDECRYGGNCWIMNYVRADRKWGKT